MLFDYFVVGDKMRVNNDKLDTKVMLEVLTPQTQKIIDDFLKHYKPISHRAYISAISNLFYVLGKDDASKLDIEDFKKVQEYFRNKERYGSQDKYCESFFKYIYAYNIIKNPKGFEKIWIKSNLINHFERLLNSVPEKVEYKPSLTIEQIYEIEELMNLEHEDNLEMLKMAFCWYMLFHTDCGVNELKSTDATKYNNNILKTNNGEYYVPEKFAPLLNHLKESKYPGFNVNGIITKLGKLVEIEGLIPQIIKNSRNENILKCSQCGNMYTNTIDNWQAVNKRIICINCADKLKKNSNLKVEPIISQNIEGMSIKDDINISSIIYTFDELRKKLSPEFDYLKLHKFQMEIGKLGEAYVYDLERKNLAGTKYQDMVDNTPAKNPSNGYDILSYDRNGNELYIEVKTEASNENDFYITANELCTARQLQSEGKKYLIYRVHNILAKDKNDITVDVIDNIINNKEYKLMPHIFKVIKC